MRKPMHVVLAITLMMAALAGAGCGDDDHSSGGSSNTETISVSGIAWVFRLGPYGRIDGATVSVLEHPDITTTTAADGTFTIEGVPVGSEATFVLSHDNHPLTYTKTFTVPADDVVDLTFQIPDWDLYRALEGLLGVQSDPTKCQIVSTFTRHGKTIGSPGAHGEPGALLTVEPATGIGEGPIYFNDFVLPDRSRTYSSIDGGVLLLNVEPGDYRLSAACMDDPSAILAEYPPDEHPDQSLRCAHEDVAFESLLMKCRPGVFLNASPSYGLQALP